MKIAHFAIYAPHACGMYSTVRDLILAERHVGIDAQFIDCGFDKTCTVREGLGDGENKTVPLEWALDEADIIIRHTAVPDRVFKEKPVLFALHGRPENSFLLEQYDISPVMSTIIKTVKSGVYKGIFTFWEEHVYLWQKILGGTKVGYIPPPVNFTEFNIVGDKHTFGNWKAEVNLVVADMWREDRTPFNLIFAAEYFRDKYNKDTKLHIYGAPVEKKSINFLAPMQRNGVVGEVAGIVPYISKIYRGADILLTPNIIATRIIRESMASGLPVVAPTGCRYTQYKAAPRDVKAFGDEIWKCYQGIHPEGKMKLRKLAYEHFNPRLVGNSMKRLCHEVLDIKSKPKGTKSTQITDRGKTYCKAVCEFENRQMRTKRRNERPVEFQFVFKHLAKQYPSTVLDVGTGLSSLPHLLFLCGFEVTATDNNGDFWNTDIFNRHVLVEQDDITDTKLSKHWDFITCVSVLEHIKDHEKAVRNMIKLLNPGGRMVLTFPYNETHYIDDVYRTEGAGYGQNNSYICQVYSRKEIDGWLKDTDCFIVEQEYWKMFHGDFWTYGRQYYPPIQTDKGSKHQLTCLLIGKA